MTRRLIGSALVVLSLLAAPADVVTGQQGSGQPGVFGEVIDVRVVNIEVVVTNRAGERVSGLESGVFRLLVDGEEVPIEFFSEVRDGVAMSAPGIATGMELAPGTEPGEPVGTSYLIFIDEYFAIKRDRDIVLKDMASDIGSIGPNDRVAVVAFTGRDLEMLSSWTNSVEEIRDVLEAARERSSSGLQRLSERNRFDDTDQISLTSEALRNDDRQINLDTYLTPEERFYASMLAGQVERAVQGAAATLRSFAAPPGRKVMLLASGGWPYMPSDFVVSDFRRTVYNNQVSGGGDLFRPLTEAANRLGYTIYTIDVPGLDRSPTNLSSSLGGSGFRRSRDSGITGARTNLGRDSTFVREQEVHYALRFVAEETGGRALLNGDRRSAFETVRSDTRSYYWLGFTPTWQGDDSYHDIKIELTDPSLVIRTRNGFLDLSRQLETTMEVESALLFGSPPSTDNPLRLTFGRPEKAGRRKMNVPLRIDIPLDRVVFLPTAEGKHQARLELRVAVIDSTGAQADIPVIPLFIDGSKTPRPDAVFSYDVSLRMRRDRHRAVVAIYDQASGNMLSGTAEVSP